MSKLLRTIGILLAIGFSAGWLSAQTAVDPALFLSGNINQLADWPPMPLGAVKGAGVSWAELETAPGVYKWGALDALVAQAQATGTKVTYVFFGTPGFAGATQASVPDMADWTAFATALATRYKGKIESYEMWNEANNPSYFNGTAAQMEALVAAASPIIQSIDPAALILSPSTGAYETVSGPAWLTQFFAAGGGKYIDVVDWHGYPGALNTAAFQPEHLMSQIANYRAVLTAAGFGNLPLWDTEGGYGLNANLPTQAAMADYLTRWYLIQLGDGVARAYWYQWDNQLWGTLESEDGKKTLTPAGQAMVQLGVELNGVTAAFPCTLGQDASTWTCAVVKDGVGGEFIWTTGALYATTVLTGEAVTVSGTPQFVVPQIVVPPVAPQHSSATVMITVTPAPLAANVSIAPASATVQAGSTANLTVTVAGNAVSGVPTGTVELLAKAPGQTTYTELSTFPLANGQAACSYPIPANAPIGSYSVEAVYLAPANGPYY